MNKKIVAAWVVSWPSGTLGGLSALLDQINWDTFLTQDAEYKLDKPHVTLSTICRFEPSYYCRVQLFEPLKTKEHARKRARVGEELVCVTIKYTPGQKLEAGLHTLSKGTLLKGNEVLQFTLALLDKLGCTKITLIDASSINTDIPTLYSTQSSCVDPSLSDDGFVDFEAYPYALIGCIESGKSFYERYGFRLSEYILCDELQSEDLYRWAIEIVQKTSLKWLWDTHLDPPRPVLNVPEGEIDRYLQVNKDRTLKEFLQDIRQNKSKIEYQGYVLQLCKRMQWSSTSPDIVEALRIDSRVKEFRFSLAVLNNSYYFQRDSPLLPTKPTPEERSELDPKTLVFYRDKAVAKGWTYSQFRKSLWKAMYGST